MSVTFTQLYAHIIFSVQGKKSFLNQNREAEIYEFIYNLVEKLGHKMLIINGTTDHIHLLVKLNPALAISDLVREVKKQSSFYVNHKLLTKHGFNWEGGYSAFTHTRSQINSLFKYIEKQKEFHRNIKFKEEYLNLKKSKENEENEELDITIFKYKYT